MTDPTLIEAMLMTAIGLIDHLEAYSEEPLDEDLLDQRAELRRGLARLLGEL